MSETNREIVRNFIEGLWNEGKNELIDAHIASDATIHDLPPGLSGREGFKQFAKAYRAAFPDLHISIESVMGEGDRVALHWTAVGTQKGALMGMAATHRTAVVHGLVISSFRDGKVTEQWSPWDGLGMLTQLGIAPSPDGSPPPRASTPEDNKRTYVAFTDEFFNKRNAASMEKYNHEFVVDLAAPPGTPPGREGVKRFWMSFLEAFPDFHFTTEELFAEGDLIISRDHITGTHRGHLAGIPPTGKKISVHTGGVTRVVNGLCVEHRGFGLLEMMQQLGVMPTPGA
jgi:steroid delta-isomerase-like uncharacterized protein